MYSVAATAYPIAIKYYSICGISKLEVQRVKIYVSLNLKFNIAEPRLK